MPIGEKESANINGNVTPNNSLAVTLPNGYIICNESPAATLAEALWLLKADQLDRLFRLSHLVHGTLAKLDEKADIKLWKYVGQGYWLNNNISSTLATRVIQEAVLYLGLNWRVPELNTSGVSVTPTNCKSEKSEIGLYLTVSMPNGISISHKHSSKTFAEALESLTEAELTTICRKVHDSRKFLIKRATFKPIKHWSRIGNIFWYYTGDSAQRYCTNLKLISNTLKLGWKVKLQYGTPPKEAETIPSAIKSETSSEQKRNPLFIEAPKTPCPAIASDIQLEIVADSERTEQDMTLAVSQDETFDESLRQKAKAQKLRVEFPGNRVFCYTSAKATFLAVLKEIGTDKLQNITLTYSYLPLISKTCYPKLKEYMEPLGDGWWVNTRSSTEEKYRQLLVIKQELNLDLKIEMGFFHATKSPDQGKKKKARSQLLVHFEDGTFIGELSTTDTFLECLAKLGIDKIYAKRIILQNKLVIANYKSENGRIQVGIDRWAKVPSSTKDKAKWLKVIGIMLGVKLECTII